MLLQTGAETRDPAKRRKPVAMAKGKRKRRGEIESQEDESPIGTPSKFKIHDSEARNLSLHALKEQDGGCCFKLTYYDRTSTMHAKKITEESTVEEISIYLAELPIALSSYNDAFTLYDKLCIDNNISFESEFESFLSLVHVGKTRVGVIQTKLQILKSSCQESPFPRSSKPTTNAIRLPKLVLPKFDGDILKFREFLEIFDAAISSSSLSDVEKFVCLREHVQGKARGTIEGLELCSANFNVTLSILKERFGNSQIHTDAHFLAMTNLPAASVKSASLRKLYDEVERNLRSLKALGQDIDHPLFIPMITSKLPQTVMMQLTMANGDEHWDVSSLRQALGKFVHINVKKHLNRSQSKPNILFLVKKRPLLLVSFVPNDVSGASIAKANITVMNVRNTQRWRVERHTRS